MKVHIDVEPYVEPYVVPETVRCATATEAQWLGLLIVLLVVTLLWVLFIRNLERIKL